MNGDRASENQPVESIIDYVTFVDEVHIIPDGSKEGKRIKVAAVDGFDLPAYLVIRREAERIRDEAYAKGERYMGPEVSIPQAIQNLLDEQDLRFTQLFVSLLKSRQIRIWPYYQSSRR